METFYVEIRTVHIVAVALSGALMLARGLAHNWSGAPWVISSPVRILTYTIDTVLLTAALMLTTIVGQYPFADSWLTAKVIFLAAYIMLGYYALRGATLRKRWAGLLGAGCVYGFIVTVARAHDPLGLFA